MTTDRSRADGGIRHPRVRLAVAALVALLALVAWDGSTLWRAQAEAQAVRAGTLPADPAGTPAQRFVNAQRLGEQGELDAALNEYGKLQSTTRLGRAARFNAANLLLRQAQVLRDQDQPGPSLALVELAKEHYRELLRGVPDDWPARYNYERAQRLVPDPEIEEELLPDESRRAERAATTMRSHSPGLP